MGRRAAHTESEYREPQRVRAVVFRMTSVLIVGVYVRTAKFHFVRVTPRALSVLSARSRARRTSMKVAKASWLASPPR